MSDFSLHRQTAIETVDLEKLQKLQYMSGLSVKDKNIIDAHIKANGELSTMYLLSERGIGRVNAKNSIGDLKSELRNTVCDSLYWDIDGVNMGVNLYLELYKSLIGDTIYTIENYINNREKILNDTMKHYTCSRYEAKQLFITIMNGGSIIGWRKAHDIDERLSGDYQFAITFAFEIKQCTEKLFDKIPSKFIIKANKKESPTISHFIYEYERKCIEYLYLTLGEPKNFIYTNDGIMVLRSQYTEEQINTIIQTAQNLIREYIQLNIQFTIKPVNEDEKIDVNNIVINTESYDYKKVEFEKQHCKIINSSNFAKTSKDSVTFFTRSELLTSYEHLKYTKLVYNKKLELYEEIQNSFIKEWMADPNIKQYESINCYPKNCPSNIFNIWQPFAAESIEESDEDNSDDVQFLLDHIKILCNHETEIYEYFIRWIGQMLVYPEIKTIFVILISEEGAGKGSLLLLLRRIMGNNKVLESQTPDRDVWGTYNGLMANSFLVAIDELEKQKAKDIAQIKGLVTEPKLLINNKGKGQYEIDSYHRFFGMTNMNDPIGTSRDDRRKMIVRSSDELVQLKKTDNAKHAEYFTRFHRILKNDNVIKKMYNYFISLDNLDTFNTLPIPTTEYHEALKEANICYVEEFIKQFARENRGNNPTCEIGATTLYTKFNEWILKNGFKFESNPIKMGLRLKTLKLVCNEKSPIIKTRQKLGQHYTFKINDLIQLYKLDEIDELPTTETLKCDCDNIELTEEIKNECEDEIEDNLANDLRLSNEYLNALV